MRNPLVLAVAAGAAVAMPALAGAQVFTLPKEQRIELTAGNPFDPQAFQAGQVTPVFFGSAMNNFGLEPFLDHFVDLAVPLEDGLAPAGAGELDQTRRVAEPLGAAVQLAGLFEEHLRVGR